METTLELGNRQRLEQFGGLRRRCGKMWESLELPRDLLDGCDQNTGDVDNKVQAEVVPDADWELE